MNEQRKQRFRMIFFFCSKDFIVWGVVFVIKILYPGMDGVASASFTFENREAAPFDEMVAEPLWLCARASLIRPHQTLFPVLLIKWKVQIAQQKRKKNI